MSADDQIDRKKSDLDLLDNSMTKFINSKEKVSL